MAEETVSSVRTTRKFCEHDYIWIVDPFGSLLKKLKFGECHIVKSPIIKTWWQEEFQMELNFKKENFDFLLSITISNMQLRAKVFGRKIKYNYRISFVRITDESQVVLHDSSTLKSNCSCSQDFSYELCNGSEVLKLSFEICLTPSNDIQSTPALLNLKDRFAAIKDMEKLFDFSIFVGEEELKISKAVLALASPVFLAMLGHDFKETKSQAIHIDDVDIDTVRRFIDFIYTSKPPTFTNLKSVFELLHMADKYEVVDLKKLCLERVHLIFPDDEV